MKRFAHRGRAASLVAVALALALSAIVRAEDAPPPADPPADETPATEPAASEPESVSVGTAIATPGPRSAGAAAWGDSTGLTLPPLAEIAPDADLDAQAASWRNVRETSQARMLKARERSLRWKSETELQKSRISMLSKLIDTAKRAKLEAEKKDLEATKTREEKKRDYFDAMRQVMEASADFHQAQVEWVQLRLAQIEQEKALGAAWAAGGYEARISADSRAREQRVLAMSKDGGDKLSALASRQRTLADRSLDALRLWGEVQP